MMETIKSIIDFLNKIVWDFPSEATGGSVPPLMVIILVGTGLFITLRLSWVQIKRLKHAIDVTRGIYDNPADAGDVTHFQALSTALSATIGIGNIAGVATAIHYGGPGALFWMWITGIFGTSLKFAECTLSMKYRKINPDGSASGGPMYYIEKGLGWKPLAVIFAVGAVISSLGQGNAIQSFTVADQLWSDFAIPTWITAAVIIGGIRRIAKVTSILAPGMTIIYLVGGLTILFLNADKIPATFNLIFKYAFSPPGMIGGFAGSFFMHTLVWGVKRGLFQRSRPGVGGDCPLGGQNQRAGTGGSCRYDGTLYRYACYLHYNRSMHHYHRRLDCHNRRAGFERLATYSLRFRNRFAVSTGLRAVHYHCRCTFICHLYHDKLVVLWRPGGAVLIR